MTCDEGIYHIARAIQLIIHEEFNDIVLCMGPCHMAKVALDCLEKCLKGNRTENIIVESSTIGIKFVNSVLGGKTTVGH